MLIPLDKSAPGPSKSTVVSDTLAVTFTANGEYLVSGGSDGVQVYRVKDGEKMMQVAIVNAPGMECPVSRSVQGWQMDRSSDRSGAKFIVWDATTYERSLRRTGRVRPQRHLWNRLLVRLDSSRLCAGYSQQQSHPSGTLHTGKRLQELSPTRVWVTSSEILAAG
jgi:hypothetical protein